MKNLDIMQFEKPLEVMKFKNNFETVENAVDKKYDRNEKMLDAVSLVFLVTMAVGMIYCLTKIL